MSDKKNITSETQENNFLKSYTDKKIQELQEGFESQRGWALGSVIG